ncbi:MAG: flavodoxin family protein [Mobilitalea sp.]
MKVLGLSFGRKEGNCDILLKEALLGAEDSGAEIKFISLAGKNILACNGCFACMAIREKTGHAGCVIKDDMAAIEKAILEADAVIISAPVYSCGPTGKLKCLIDRMGISHDIAFSEAINERRMEEGKSGDELLDPQLFKDRFLGLISVGGATEEHWTSMGLPNMHLFAFSMQMPVIDHYSAYDLNLMVSPVLNEKLIARMNLLGKNVTAAIGTPKYEAAWKGDKDGICPGCHNDLLRIHDGTHIECPICGMKGTISIVDGKVKANFAESELEHSRMRFGGIQEHYLELTSIQERIPNEIKAQIPTIKEKLKRYEGIISEI